MKISKHRKLLLGILAGPSLIFLSSEAMSQKIEEPNIILIITDDHRADAMGYSGNEIIKTPEMDKLASEGVYFHTAMVTTPICAASRASILTGLYERTHGYTFAQGEIKQPYMESSYPVVLKKGGYHTGFFGKFGVAYNNIEQLFDEFESYDRKNEFPDRRSYFYQTIREDTVHLTRYTGHQAQEFIKNAPKDKPFSLSLSFSAPHAADSAPDQYFWQEKSNDLYIDETIPLPMFENQYIRESNDNDSKANYITLNEKLFKDQPKEVQEGFNRVRWRWRFDTPEKYQKSVKGYYRMITEIDDEIRGIRKVLEEKGIADNTVIIFMGDNGYFLGERQLAGKWLMYDLSIRIPLMIYDPRVEKHYDVDDLILNIDIPKTILSLAGLKVPEIYQGLDLMPYVTDGEHSKKRKAALVEHLWEIPQIPSSEGIRTERWKYFRYRFIKAPEELYDLKNDPKEEKNLAKEDQYQVILKNLRKQMNNKIKKYEEARLVPHEPTQYDDDGKIIIEDRASPTKNW